jgi:hypothetical protein
MQKNILIWFLLTMRPGGRMIEKRCDRVVAISYRDD